MALDIKTVASQCVGLPFDWQATIGVSKDYSKVTVVDACTPPVIETVTLHERDLAVESGLHSFVLISLFTDRRASEDDVLPHNNNNRKGWVGDEFNDGELGSHLWLGRYTKRTDDWLDFMRFAAKEALEWMINDGVVDVIETQARWVGEEKIGLQVQLYQGEQAIYEAAWRFTVGQPEQAVCLPIKSREFPPIDLSKLTWTDFVWRLSSASLVGNQNVYPVTLASMGFGVVSESAYMNSISVVWSVKGFNQFVGTQSVASATSVASRIYNQLMSSAAVIQGTAQSANYNQLSGATQ